jgi:hypothetical protein
MPGSSGHQSELKNPESSECQNDNRPEDHCEQKRHRKRKMALKDQEVHLGALLVLKDEDKDHDQDNDADDKRGPSSTKAGFSLARVRFLGWCALVGGSFNHLRKS